MLFKGRRAWVERTCDRWFILSAKHGLLGPQDVVAPYDQTLSEVSASERRTWSERVLTVLDAREPSWAGVVVEIHAGVEYREYGLENGLRRRGAEVIVPARGLPIGRQLAFYKKGPGDS